MVVAKKTIKGKPKAIFVEISMAGFI